MKSLKYKNVTLMFKNRLPRKKKKRTKKAIDMFENQLTGNMILFMPNLKINHY